MKTICDEKIIRGVIMNDLQFAINMELDGEKFYRRQAEINKDNSLHSVCLMMAEDEKMHAQILTDKLNEMLYQLKNNDTLAQAKNIFDGIRDIKVEGKSIPSQLDFYRLAADLEKQSIDLYSKYLSQVIEEQEKELFEYLINQEKQHLAILDELVSLLSHAEQWVENAEFGLRKEY